MSATNYAIAFTVAGKLASSFSSSFKNANGILGQTNSKIAELNRQASNVSGMLKHKQAVGQAAKAHQQAQTQMRELVRQAQLTGTAVNRDSKEFKQAEAAINRTGKALDKARASMKAFAASSGLGGQSMGALKSSQAGLQEKIAAQSRRDAGRQRYEQNSANLMAVGIYAADSMRSVVREGMEFESMMARVGAVSRASGADLEAMTAKARELGANTVWSASQAAEGMQYLSMAGFKVNETIAAMPGMLDLASAGAIELGQAADIASNILTGFGLAADKMGQAGDVLVNTFTTSNTTLNSLGETMKYVAPVAKNLNVSLEQTAAMAGMLGNAGIQGSEAGTGLRMVLLRLASPARQGAAALKALGVQTKDASGNMLPAGQILAQIGQAMEKLPTAKAAEFAAAIYGKNAVSSGMVLQAAAASGELDKYTASLSKAGSAAEVAAKQNDTAAGRVRAMQSAMSEFKISAFYALEPVISGITKALTGMVNAINFLNSIAPGASTVIYSLLAAVAALTIAVPICTTVHGAWAAAMGWCASMGLTLGGVMAFLTSPIMLVVAAIAAVVAITYVVVSRWEDIIAFINGTFVPAWTAGWETVKSTFSAVADWIMDKLSGVMEFLSSVGDALGAVGRAFSGGGGSAGGGHVPGLASGGIVSQPTLAMIGEGNESEAVIPLSKLESMIGGGTGGGMAVSFSPTIYVRGGGSDAYEQVRRGLSDGADDLKRQLMALQTQNRRVGYA